jgi:hypothetical protein
MYNYTTIRTAYSYCILPAPPRKPPWEWQGVKDRVGCNFRGKWTAVGLASRRLQYKGTVTRVGGPFPRWFLVELEVSVVSDGWVSRMPASAQRLDAKVAGQ